MNKNKPNIILFMSDQHRADSIGIEGNPVILTPNLDHIAAEGVRFSKCYSTCPISVPARRSLISGQFPHTHGARVNIRREWDISFTLPGVLKKAGYHTYLVGRDMHQYPERKRFGFDHMVTQYDYFEWLNKKIPNNLYPKDVHYASGPYYTSGVMHNDWTARPWHLDESLHMTNWIINQALEFLQNRDPDCPFFLVVSFLAPHPPLIPPQFYMDRYLRQDLPKPVIGDWSKKPKNNGRGFDVGSFPSVYLEGEALKSCIAGYYGLINYMDDQIRRILNPVDGIYKMAGKDTVILYTSDHGEMLGDHYMWGKEYPYESSARIPLFINLPERFGIRKGLVLDKPVCLEDIMPTLLELADLEIPDTVEGISLLPLMREDKESLKRSYIHIEREKSHHSFTDGKEKYVYLLGSGEEQLFDLVNDNTECFNLAQQKEYSGRLAYWRDVLLKELARYSIYENDMESFKNRIKNPNK